MEDRASSILFAVAFPGILFYYSNMVIWTIDKVALYILNHRPSQLPEQRGTCEEFTTVNIPLFYLRSSS